MDMNYSYKNNVVDSVLLVKQDVSPSIVGSLLPTDSPEEMKVEATSSEQPDSPEEIKEKATSSEQPDSPDEIKDEVLFPDIQHLDSNKTIHTFKLSKFVWPLLHILSLRVREHNFDRIRRELLDIIYFICSHVHCTDCTSAAIKYFDTHDFYKIVKKQELIDFLLEFHNHVNKEYANKNVIETYTTFTHQDLHDTYYDIIPYVVIEEFKNFHPEANNYVLNSKEAVKYVVKWLDIFRNGFYFWM